MLRELKDDLYKVALNMNINKTKLITNLRENTKVQYIDLEQVDTYKYFGHGIKLDKGQNTNEITQKIGVWDGQFKVYIGIYS